jgi:hypothetical protein
MKFCKDCAHCKPFVCASEEPDYGIARCGAALARIDLVTGKKIYRFCELERSESPDRCGPEARNFEPITPKP